MKYSLNEFDLLVSSYNRKNDFTGAYFMTSFPANAHRKSKCIHAHFEERTLKYQNQLSKQVLLRAVTGP